MNNVEKLEHIIYLINKYENKIETFWKIKSQTQLVYFTTESNKEGKVNNIEKLDDIEEQIENIAKIYIERIKAILKDKS